MLPRCASAPKPYAAAPVEVSAAAMRIVVAAATSGFNEMESIPWSTSQTANSG